MVASPRLGYTFLTEGETIPETAVNEIALFLEAAAGHFIFQGFGTNAPPASPAQLDTYWTGSSPTGAWAGQANKIAIRINTAWAIVTAKVGYTAWLVGSGLNGYDGTAWVEPTVGAGSSTVQLAVEEDGVEESASVKRFNFTGNVNVTVVGDEAQVDFPASSTFDNTENDARLDALEAAVAGSGYTDVQARKATQEWAPNFTGAADLYIPAREAMTIDQGNAKIGTGTLAYGIATAAAVAADPENPTVTPTALPATLGAGDYLRVRAFAVTGFVATHLKRIA